MYISRVFTGEIAQIQTHSPVNEAIGILDEDGTDQIGIGDEQVWHQAFINAKYFAVLLI
jgi:hypothetical protein